MSICSDFFAWRKRAGMKYQARIACEREGSKLREKPKAKKLSPKQNLCEVWRRIIDVVFL
jgi:hypothetical protein